MGKEYNREKERRETPAFFLLFRWLLDKLSCLAVLRAVQKACVLCYLPAAENLEFLNQILTFMLLRHYMGLIHTALPFANVQCDNERTMQDCDSLESKSNIFVFSSHCVQMSIQCAFIAQPDQLFFSRVCSGELY